VLGLPGTICDIPAEVLLPGLCVGRDATGVELPDDPARDIIAIAGVVDEVWAPLGRIERAALKGDDRSRCLPYCDGSSAIKSEDVRIESRMLGSPLMDAWHYLRPDAWSWPQVPDRSTTAQYSRPNRQHSSK